ncbi:hypothetical protein KUF54_02210 [Comamonas sp. Y33R10-2]|uniref:hypothetical protein n=1 Tax=Comamonas sp. Y33R10-2 TaxID=2853257 RepID=UPI001C5C8531|nr:hypothetical protein [Comamonas sp. Y33R10-2]QXZ10101.1 hypothetical protein KUF54_02210 [Comamonas sp. Y33R10-2]
MSALYRLTLAAVMLAAGGPALAGDWQICDLKVQVLEKQSGGGQLQALVLAARSKGQAECPQPGAALSFRPETADYQSELPRRKWPKAGSTVTVRYRYLDGECKSRGPCRIEHYSPVLR